LKMVIAAAHQLKPTALYIVRELPSKSCAKVWSVNGEAVQS